MTIQQLHAFGHDGDEQGNSRKNQTDHPFCVDTLSDNPLDVRQDMNFRTHMQSWLNVGVETPGILEGFGESPLYAITPGNIAAHIFSMKLDSDSSSNMQYLQRMQQTLHDNLEGMGSRVPPETTLNTEGVFKPWMISFHDRWRIYSVLHASVERHHALLLRDSREEA